MKRKIIVLLVCFVMALGMIPATVVSATAQAVSVSYQTHVQDIGWQGFVSDGAISGTSGQSKRLEGIEISVSGNSNLGIKYSTQIQDIGWQGYFADGAMSGTSGQSKRLEAIKIELTGSDAPLYDVYYHVHAQDYGWLGWAKDGESSGTEGFSKRLEAIEICIVGVGAPAPGSTDNAFVKYVAPVAVSYKTHVQDYGWQGLVTNGATSGTSGESKRLEGICISLSGLPVSGSVIYRTHVQDYGWMSWVSDGAMSGTSGQSKRLEAIEIKLAGDATNNYDIYYRVHAQNFGWLDWAKNGASAGTAGYGYRLEAIQIVLVTKGGVAPGSTTRPYATPVITYKDGMYKIGTDMPAGEYNIIGDGAYFEVAKDSTGTFDSIICNDFFYGNSIISVENGQYLKISNGVAYAIANAPAPKVVDGYLPEGMYKVGVDFSAGEYKLKADGDGYFEVDVDSSHKFSSIITNDIFSGETYITVKTGQYLVLSSCSIKVQ